MSDDLKLPKASPEEVQRLQGFLEDLARMSAGRKGVDDDREIAQYVAARLQKIDFGWRKIFCGYSVLVQNTCDPDSDSLEWNPELARAIRLAEWSKNTLEVDLPRGFRRGPSLTP